ncbi:MAG: hypothetical protein ACLUD0_12105 [Eubacterium ramulus]
MKNQLLHTPEGVRDIYNEECERKIILEGRLLSVLKILRLPSDPDTDF